MLGSLIFVSALSGNVPILLWIRFGTTYRSRSIVTEVDRIDRSLLRTYPELKQLIKDNEYRTISSDSLDDPEDEGRKTPRRTSLDPPDDL